MTTVFGLQDRPAPSERQAAAGRRRGASHRFSQRRQKPEPDVRPTGRRRAPRGARRRDPLGRRARVRRRPAAHVRRPPRGAARRADRSGRSGCSPARLPDFLAETRAIREDPDWRVAEAPPDLQDRRVEITGPTDRKMVINALNSRRARLHGRLRGRELADLANLVEGQREPDRRGRADDLARHGREELPAERRDRDAARPPARLAPAGAPRARRRRAGLG